MDCEGSRSGPGCAMALMFVTRGSCSSTTSWLTAYFDGVFWTALEEEGRLVPVSCWVTTGAATSGLVATGAGVGGAGGAGCAGGGVGVRSVCC
uniref:Putative secreted protein n=1 Tax=Ixodes ricinus TaxID=34613 RepID=A0A6B0UE14_IXORI